MSEVSAENRGVLGNEDTSTIYCEDIHFFVILALNMKFKKFCQYFSGIILGLFVLIPSVLASTGFVTAPLSLNPESPKEGDKAVLSAVFRNDEQSTLTGTIIFYDGAVLLAKKPITILSNEVGTASVTFTISAGSHDFSATMSSADKLLTSGKLGVVSLPVSTVTMPSQFVPKIVNLSAAAGGQTDLSSAQPILNQIDKAETGVLSAVPGPIKDVISSGVKNIEAWRQAAGNNFSAGIDDANKIISPAVKSKKSATSSSTTNSAVSADSSGSSLDGPLAYVKLFTYTILAFIFSSAVVFYLVGIFLIYIIIRFIFRRIRRARGKGH